MSKSIGLVQKCGGNGVVSPDHCATLVRTSRIFMMKVFFPVLEMVKILQFAGQVTRNSERPIRGSCTSSLIRHSPESSTSESRVVAVARQLAALHIARALDSAAIPSPSTRCRHCCDDRRCGNAAAARDAEGWNGFHRHRDGSAGRSDVIIVIIPQQHGSFAGRAGCQGVNIRRLPHAVPQNIVQRAAPLLIAATRSPLINPAMRKKFSTGLSTPLVASVR